MYLYRSWDDSLYLTESIDGSEGLLSQIGGSTTVKDLLAFTGITEALEIFKAYLGKPSSIEVFI